MTMDMTMDMAGPTTSSVMPSATGQAMDHDMGGMGGMGNNCKISMLWNWNTIDSCFISSSWHITSKGMFAGSCIGVLLLVMTLEALRRASREYDAYIVHSHQQSIGPPQVLPANLEASPGNANKALSTQSTTPLLQPTTFTPTLSQQLIRSLLHMAQFAVAYFVMLLAMYYNGYMIICIFIGAFVGAFVFSWHSMTLPGDQRSVTYCCG